MEQGKLHRRWPRSASRLIAGHRADSRLLPLLLLCLVLPGATTVAVVPGAAALAPAVVLILLAVLSGLAVANAVVQHRRSTGRQHALEEAQAALAMTRAQSLAQAVTDPLTDLPNRRALIDAYDARQKPLAERDLVLSLLLVDVDDFGRVQAIAGSDAADRLLLRLARVLSASVRRTDVVGRIGRDRFLLILVSLRYGGVAEEISERLFARLAEDNAANRDQPALSVSIGSVDIGRPGNDFPAALRKAELALVHGRRQGRGRAECHSPSLDRENDRFRRLAADLRNPETTAIVPLYRPRLGRERQIAGLRALPHWRRPDGTLQPLDPASLAAAPDLAGHLSDRLVEAVLRDIGLVGTDMSDPLRFILPLAFERVVEAEFPERLLDRLLEAGLSPRRIEILPCGTHQPQLLERLARTLEALGNAGVATMLDMDCGLPVTELRRLRLNGLGLGPRLIHEVAVDDGARATAQALVQLAHAQGRTVVAEGADTLAIEQVLGDVGCDFAEGDCFSAPLPIARVPDALRRGLGTPERAAARHADSA